MKKDELYYKLALSRVDGIGPVRYKKLMEQFTTAEEIFSKTIKQLKAIAGLSELNAKAIKAFTDFSLIERELDFVKQHDIQVLDYAHPNYPRRLRHCADSPSVLFYKGTEDLNQQKVVSIIGTRSFTEYGRRVCEELVEGLKLYNVTVVSGLAFGIDAIAHKACIRAGMPTIGVVAHGLDTMYPAAHRNLSKEMMQHGGILSEYYAGTKADKGNFPARNRIVAGMSDATIIIETDRRGGSMITAEIAYSYNRDVFCVPGRMTDAKSNGCNDLIKSLKAQMITNAEDIANSLGWVQQKKPKHTQRNLFVELNANESMIVALLKINASMHIDELSANTALNSSALASSLLSLEMQHIIRVMPGKLVSLLD
jgi:DNA processing protein